MFIEDIPDAVRTICDGWLDATSDRQELQQEIEAARRAGRAGTFDIQREVSPDVAERVRALGVKGCRRCTPKASATTPTSRWPRHVLGYVGRDNKGLGGLEGDLRPRSSAARKAGSCSQVGLATHSVMAVREARAGDRR